MRIVGEDHNAGVAVCKMVDGETIGGAGSRSSFATCTGP